MSQSAYLVVALATRVAAEAAGLVTKPLLRAVLVMLLQVNVSCCLFVAPRHKDTYLLHLDLVLVRLAVHVHAGLLQLLLLVLVLVLALLVLLLRQRLVLVLLLIVVLVLLRQLLVPELLLLLMVVLAVAPVPLHALAKPCRVSKLDHHHHHVEMQVGR